MVVGPLARRIEEEAAGSGQRTASAAAGGTHVAGQGRLGGEQDGDGSRTLLRGNGPDARDPCQ